MSLRVTSSIYRYLKGDREDDDDFDDLPDFTEDTIAEGVDLFDYPDESCQHMPDYNFANVHKKPTPFNTIRTNCWIPGKEIEVKVIAAERVDATTKLFNPNLYTVQIKHGTFQWTVRRRYKHFASLHQHLRLFRMKHKFPVPSRAHRQRRQSLQGTRKVPRFPKKPDIIIRTEKDYDKRKRHLEDYLQTLVNISVYRNHIETLKFFEVSHLSFIGKLGQKRKEGMVMKCSGGRHISIGCCGCLRKFHLAGRWKKRWLFLKDSCLAYVRPRDGIICDVMLMDNNFGVENGFGLTGAKHGLQIVNLNRCLLAKCWTGRKADEWQASIEEVAKTTAKDYTDVARFEAFAPVREKSYAQWFIDGDSYFSAVADALEEAQEEIFISDWWLSPEIYMKRPITEGNKWRLDSILQRKARQGVKIFVLLYKEMSIAVNLLSTYSKHTLMNLCQENIKVLRHPDHRPGGVLLWAHHEKIVAIDQKVAFLGGLDLCYGRWDNYTHPLTDLGSITYGTVNQNLDSIQAPESNDHIFNFSDFPTSVNSGGCGENSQDLNGITLNIIPPSPKLDKCNSDPECVCGRERSATHNSDKSYDNHSLEADDESHNLIGSGSQNQMVVTATIHESPSENERLHQKFSSIDEESNSRGGPSVKEDKEPEVEESDTESVKDMKRSFDSRPKLHRMESTTEHALKYMDQVSDENTVPVVVHSEEQPKDVYSMSAKEVQESIHRKSVKAKGEKSQVQFAGVEKEPVFDKIEQIQDENVEIRSYQKLDDENQGSFRNNKRVASDSGILSNRKSLSVKEKRSEPHQVNSDHTAGSKRESWAIRKLRRSFSHGHEQNNNLNINTTEHAGDNGPYSPTTTALHRWKMVLNVQKFQSAIKQQQQEPVPLPKEKEKRPVTPKISKLFHLNRSSSDSSTGMKDSLEKPALIQRTKSEIAIDELGLKGSSKLWIGKDYCNNIHKDFVDLNVPFEDFIDRHKTPRMPWHDIGAVVYGKSARDVSRHFIGRWNITKQEKCKNNKDYPLLLPKAYTANNTLPAAITGSSFEVKSQILRSLSGWSGGIRTTECSIQTAYLHCIESAKHYIYIENQFFITQVGDKSVIKNKIGDALFNRILRAHRNGENFRVYVVMPLLPAFEGDIGGDGGYTIRTVTHYTYTSISKGPFSLWGKLAKEVLDPLKYIVFCGLRNYDELSSKPVTELVYVHSKLLIADDDTAIIGSANINDRSLLGDRDSEIAVMVQDIHKTETKFAGIPHMVGKFATSLRKSLFSEHLGIPVGDPVLDDPVCDTFYKNVFLRRATVNSNVFQKVFNCIPSDLVLSFAELNQQTSEKTMAETEPEKARKELKKVQGHIVLLPLHFMESESSIIPAMGKEMFLPVYVWI